MKHAISYTIAAFVAVLSGPAMAEMAESERRNPVAAPGTPGGEYLQCVPYARQVSGVRIFGDAHTWWEQAQGRYARGSTPRIGAVMAFEPHRNMRLGHVAAVSRVIDSRTVLIRHANWSEIDGRRGLIEDDVRAVDVSPANDWSQVRVWYAPTDGLGTTAWPVRGFIYPERTPTMAAPRVQIAARSNNSTAPRTAQAQLRAVAPAPARVAPARVAPAAAPARAAPASRNSDFAAAMAMDDLVAEGSFAGSFSGLR